MCNAYNHPPGCDCGWGGVWYGAQGGYDSWLFGRGVQHRTLGQQRGTRDPICGSYVDPNAKCPVCGIAVYFYKSPYGGRVFFDELGPPWPKHACTSSAPAISHDRWVRQGWKPLTGVSIHAVVGYQNVYSIEGRLGASSRQFFFCAKEVVMAEVVRFRRRVDGMFDVSILDFDSASDGWASWEGPAHASVKKAIEVGVALQCTVHGSGEVRAFPPRHRSANGGGSPKVAALPRRLTYQCPFCDTTADDELGLDRHVSRLHDPQWPKYAEGAAVRSRLESHRVARCEACKLLVKRLQRHMRKAHADYGPRALP